MMRLDVLSHKVEQAPGFMRSQWLCRIELFSGLILRLSGTSKDWDALLCHHNRQPPYPLHDVELSGHVGYSLLCDRRLYSVTEY